jgi:hypothetical protein
MMLRAKQGQRLRRGFGRITIDSRSRLSQDRSAALTLSLPLTSSRGR